MSQPTILVAGAGGFIGGHLVADFVSRGYKNIRAVDIKPFDEWYQVFDGVENVAADLKELDACRAGVPRARTRSTTWPPTWAAWASSRTTRRCACCRC